MSIEKSLKIPDNELKVVIGGIYHLSECRYRCREIVNHSIDFFLKTKRIHQVLDVAKITNHIHELNDKEIQTIAKAAVKLQRSVHRHPTDSEIYDLIDSYLMIKS